MHQRSYTAFILILLQNPGRQFPPSDGPRFPRTQNLLLSWTRSTFDADQALIKGYLLHLKIAISSVIHDDFVTCYDLTHDALCLARKISQKMHKLNQLVLDELDRVMTYHWMSAAREVSVSGQPNFELREYFHWAGALQDMKGCLTGQSNFLSLAVNFHVTEYVRVKLKQDKTLFRKKQGQPFLLYLHPNRIYPVSEGLEMMKILISHGPILTRGSVRESAFGRLH